MNNEQRHDHHTDGSITVGTKMSIGQSKILSAACEKMGITPYDFLQTVLDTLLAFTTDERRLSPEMSKLMRRIAKCKWQKAFDLQDSAEDYRVLRAWYLVVDMEGKSRRMVMVNYEPELGEQVENMNQREVLEMFVYEYDQGLYRHMRAVGVELGTTCVLETIDAMLDEVADSPDLRELQDLFGDNQRSDSGKQCNQYGEHVRTRMPHGNM